MRDHAECAECGRLFRRLTEATHAFFKIDSRLKLAQLTEDDGVLALETERQRAADEREQALIEIARHEQDAHRGTAHAGQAAIAFIIEDLQ